MNPRSARFRIDSAGTPGGRFAAAAALLLACAAASASVRNVDLVYNSPGNTTRNRFDLYTSNSGVRYGAPTIIDLHGGGYVQGDKGLDQQLCYILADMGYNVCSMNYTLAVPGVSSSFPQTFRDVRAMIAWVRTTGVSLGLSPTIVVIGQSAGATVGLAAALAPSTPEFDPPIPVPPGGYRVDALIGLFGRYDLVWDAQTYGSPQSIMNYLGMPITAQGGLSRYAAAAARTYVDSCSPPTKLIVGDADGVVPPGNTYRLASALSNAGVLVIQQILPGVGHGEGPLSSPSWLANSITTSLPVLLAASQPSCGQAPPPNDACSSATQLLPGDSITNSNVGATTDGVSSCGRGDTRDVWYQFVAPATMRYTFDTLDSSGLSDTTLTLFETCPPGVELECNDDADFGGLSSLSYVFIAGQSALIRVAANSGAAGSFQLHVDSGVSAMPPPLNDECRRAATATLGISLGTTIGATEDSIGGIGPNGPCCPSDDLDVWFSFVAPSAALYRFDTLGSVMMPDTTLTVLGGCNGPVLACNDDNGPGDTASLAEVELLAGQQVFIRIAAPNRAEGSFLLNITLVHPAALGACCVNGDCTDTNEYLCTNGEFLDGQVCASANCPAFQTGACCNGTICSLVSGPGACSGSFGGLNVLCGAAGNPTTCCPANFNRIGGVTVQDIFDYLAAYFGSAPAADFNQNGAVSTQDLFDFLAAYFTGC